METPTTRPDEAAPAAQAAAARSGSAGPEELPGLGAPAPDSFSLLQHVTSGALTLPREHRAQRGFFRLLRKVGSDPSLIEGIQRLRDAVILSAVRDKTLTGGVTVALTGVTGGEGVSLISLLLGLALGEARQRRVAFLDGRFDVQRFQVLADVLGLSKSAAMRHKGGSHQVVGYYNEWQPNVYFLRSAGIEDSMQFFSDRRLGLFLTDLRQHFDYTILDLPPLLKGPASVFAIPHVDRIYVVAEAGKTFLSQMGHSVEAIEHAGGQLSGVILNKQRAPFWSRFLWREFFF
ncbi:MAG: hypothetical protein HY721_18020 [Planctomycetes bacterium]|nr:hypothetical protein [Planctomycetota bacterium]